MSNEAMLITLAAGLAAFLLAVTALLKGWTGWLELKRAELRGSDGSPAEAGAPSPVARIELADLKERVRRLEAIANGVEG
jgi:hypothetical protein